ASGRNPAQSQEIYLGHTDLGVGANRAQSDILWQNASMHTWAISYDGGSTITVTVDNGFTSLVTQFDYATYWASQRPDTNGFSLESFQIFAKDTDRNDADGDIDVHQQIGNLSLTNGTTTLDLSPMEFDTSLNADQSLRFTTARVSGITGFESGAWTLSGTWTPTSVSTSTNGSFETSTLEFSFGGDLWTVAPTPIPEPTTSFMALSALATMSIRRRRSA
ncbi:MAG: PEP-CTERM sorting domain-containing protein, partial [Verrucomicrobiota bacterium]